jgi:hypothetical protein
MDQLQAHGRESTKSRSARAMKAKAFDPLRTSSLWRRVPRIFYRSSNGAKVSVAHYLKRLHNLAVGGFGVARLSGSRPTTVAQVAVQAPTRDHAGRASAYSRRRKQPGTKPLLSVANRALATADGQVKLNLVHPEDRALLGSNLSAAVNSNTAGLGGLGRPGRLPAGSTAMRKIPGVRGQSPRVVSHQTKTETCGKSTLAFSSNRRFTLNQYTTN